MEIDYDVSLFIITEFNEYILPQDYIEKDDGEGIFVCLTNDRLNSDYGFNNSVCIHKEWKALLDDTSEMFPNDNQGIMKDPWNHITSIWQNEESDILNNENIDMTEMKKKLTQIII